MDALCVWLRAFASEEALNDEMSSFQSVTATELGRRYAKTAPRAAYGAKERMRKRVAEELGARVMPM